MRWYSSDPRRLEWDIIFFLGSVMVLLLANVVIQNIFP
jgi:hypothetical protein